MATNSSSEESTEAGPPLTHSDFTARPPPAYLSSGTANRLSFQLLSARGSRDRSRGLPRESGHVYSPGRPAHNPYIAIVGCLAIIGASVYF